MRHSVALLFVMMLLVLALLTSCGGAGDRTYDEDEVCRATAQLIERSVLINRIYWGTGIPVSDAQDASTSGRYVEADGAFLAEHGIETIEDLKEMTTMVYDSGFCKTIFDTKLKAVSDSDGSVVSFVRYYQNKAEDVHGTAVLGSIMVDTEAVRYFEDDPIYHTDTLQVTRVEGEVVYLTLTVTVKDYDGMPVDQQLVVAVIEEEAGWRLVNPTYDTYVQQNPS